ncbi:CpsD/CapB family tyrosine-protein kinase [Eubacteriaceae bacterium ES2]|nr:CpsD/CapB family tyrosine-protein kinase [Eubacteriaceae bacterium ES2]
MDTSKLVILRDPDSFETESYKLLRTNLNFKNSNHHLQVMLLTSAGKQEGKSTTIANLAITFAQSNQKVLLIDCDLRQPKQAGIFGINKMKTGLTNLMVDQLPHETGVNSIPNLSLDVMTAGSKKVSAAELLNSEDFEEMIKSFRKIYDLILIDTPPVLSFADASIISRVVDGVILVVASGETKKAMVVESKKNLDKVGANLVGVILTKMKFARNPEYYRYDYKKRKRHFL